jgi:putative transposase
MKVSTSAYYSWLQHPVSDRDWADAHLTNRIVDIHRMSRRCYGSPWVHAELRLDEDIRCSRKRVERLMRQAGIAGSIGAGVGAAPAATLTPCPPTTW